MPDLTLQRYMTRDVFKLETLGPGTYYKTLEIRGNAILSSVFIKSLDGGASLKVNFFQTTSGTIDDPERFDLTSHQSLTTTGTDQIAVTRIHNKPVVEVIVAGGDVEFGVYLTVMDQLATDIDSALVTDDTDADLINEKGIPIACHNDTTGKWEILRCPFPVTIEADNSGGSEGTPFHRQGQITTSNLSNNPNSLDSFSVPAAKVRNLSQVIVSTYVDGIFTLKADGAILAKGRTGPASNNVRFSFNPKMPISAGVTVTLEFDQIYQTPSDCNVDWHIHMSEVDA